MARNINKQNIYSSFMNLYLNKNLNLSRAYLVVLFCFFEEVDYDLNRDFIMTISEIQKRTSLTQAIVKNSLNYLKQANIITAKKDKVIKKRNVYRFRKSFINILKKHEMA